MALNNHTYHDVAIIARAIAADRGHGPDDTASTEVFLAALVTAIGPERSTPLLQGAGVENPQVYYAQLPEMDITAAASLPSITPDATLRGLLVGPLKDFRKGQASALEALEVLLQLDHLNAAIEAALGISPPDLAPVMIHRAGLHDTKSLVRKLARIYQARYTLGSNYCGPTKEQAFPDFVNEPDNPQFCRILRNIYQTEASLWADTFGSAAYEASPLGQVRRDHGETGAHILGAVLLAEMNLVGSLEGLHVLDLGYILDPVNSFRFFGKARHAVQTLQLAGLLETVSCPGTAIRLRCTILPSEPIMDEWENFLAAGSIAPEEIEGPMGVI